jgi:Coenzyme PQQ synthesis protein D (PqqD)
MSLQSNWRPKAVKGEGLLVEEAGNEVVIYNLEGHRVHCLNEQAVRIWKLCNGTRTVKQIAGKLDIALDPASREVVVGNATAQFERLGLVEAFAGAPAIISRRDMTRRIGIGAAAVVLPLITSIVAPTQAQTASNIANGGACTSSKFCASGCCCNSSSATSKRLTCQMVGTCGGAGQGGGCL